MPHPILASAAVLRDLEPEVLDAISDSLQWRNIDDGEVLLEEGQHGEGLFFVARGRLKVETHDDQLAMVDAGGCVGEIGLLTGATSNATVRAQGEARVGVLSPKDFEAIIARFDHLRLHLMALASLRLFEVALFDAPIFGALDHQTRRRLASECRWVDLDGGERLFAIGDEAEAAYIVLAGRLEVLNADGVRIGELSSGEILGEAELLAEVGRTTAVRAVRDTRLVRVARSPFLSVLDACPEILRPLSRGILRRMMREQGLIESKTGRLRTIAVMHASEAPVEGFVHALSVGLGRQRTVTLRRAEVERALGHTIEEMMEGGVLHGLLLNWLRVREQLHNVAIYACDGEDTAWTRLCLRQADRIYVTGKTKDPPALAPIETSLAEIPPLAPVELVLVGDGMSEGQAQSWRAPRPWLSRVHTIDAGQPELLSAWVRRLMASA